jgi:hypothetical protein
MKGARVTYVVTKGGRLGYCLCPSDPWTICTRKEPDVQIAAVPATQARPTTFLLPMGLRSVMLAEAGSVKQAPAVRLLHAPRRARKWRQLFPTDSSCSGIC